MVFKVTDHDLFYASFMTRRQISPLFMNYATFQKDQAGHSAVVSRIQPISTLYSKFYSKDVFGYGPIIGFNPLFCVWKFESLPSVLLTKILESSWEPLVQSVLERIYYINGGHFLDKWWPFWFQNSESSWENGPQKDKRSRSRQQPHHSPMLKRA